MKVLIMFLSAVSILLSCSKGKKAIPEINSAVSSSGVINNKLDPVIFPMQAKWFYNDLNTVFVSHVKSMNKGC